MNYRMLSYTKDNWPAIPTSLYDAPARPADETRTLTGGAVGGRLHALVGRAGREQARRPKHSARVVARPQRYLMLNLPLPRFYSDLSHGHAPRRRQDTLLDAGRATSRASGDTRRFFRMKALAGCVC